MHAFDDQHVARLREIVRLDLGQPRDLCRCAFVGAVALRDVPQRQRPADDLAPG